MPQKVILLLLIVFPFTCFAQTESLNSQQFCAQIASFASHIATNRDNGVSLRQSIKEMPNAESIITEIYKENTPPRETGLRMYKGCLKANPAYDSANKQLSITTPSGRRVARAWLPTK